MTHDPHPYADDELAEETGLNLFDDRASLAGNFPHAVWGYDKANVDAHVRDIEQQVSTLKQLTRRLRSDLRQAQLAAASTGDFTKLGAHATQVLRAAENQAKKIVSLASQEAERIKEEGRRSASELRANVQAEADSIRVASLADQREARQAMDTTIAETLAAAQIDAASTVEAAKRHAQAIRDEAESQAANRLRETQALIEKSRAEAERAQAEAAAAARVEIEDMMQRAKLAQRAAQDETDRLKADTQRHNDEATTTTRKQIEEMLAAAHLAHSDVVASADGLRAESTKHHEESAAQLAAEAQQAQQIRAQAVADAEHIRARAAREAETHLAGAHQHAAMMKDRLEEQYAWRKEQLERETNALLQRKASVVAQLGSLRELSAEALRDYPNEDPFAGFESAIPEPTAQTPKAHQPASPGPDDATQALPDPEGAHDVTTVVDQEDALQTQQLDPQVTKVLDTDAEPTSVVASSPATPVSPIDDAANAPAPRSNFRPKR